MSVPENSHLCGSSSLNASCQEKGVPQSFALPLSTSSLFPKCDALLIGNISSSSFSTPQTVLY